MFLEILQSDQALEQDIIPCRIYPFYFVGDAIFCPQLLIDFEEGTVCSTTDFPFFVKICRHGFLEVFFIKNIFVIWVQNFEYMIKVRVSENILEISWCGVELVEVSSSISIQVDLIEDVLPF